MRGENQRISVGEAIKAWTLDGANATFEENTKGSIIPSKLADFVVLEKDPPTVPPDTIQDIVIEATYLGGENYDDANHGDGDEEEKQSLYVH